MKSFENKVVVITGGNSGIGKAIAKSFYVQGAKIVVFGRDQSKLQSVATEFSGNITTVQGDVTKLSDLDKLYKTVNDIHGKVDILVANAGIAGGQIIDEVDEHHFDEIMNINLKGAYFTVQKAVPFLKSNASVVMISSMACHGGWKGLSVYSAAKAAISVLAKSFSADLINRGIRVNSISPGFTDTPIFTDKNVIPVASELVPIKRFATPEEIADAAMFLSSNQYIVGIDLLIDGGVSTLRPEFR
ncbi:SDR family oxidoreductase [Candidatus Berkiella cookevillensis]|uniref:Glucose 1-dehydrogenase 4 n=1 Tax=Candidatus Berkiella cookevillensis TaxID=437022 RepID=A0A0Q9YPZ1_9GAMM|nr:SDR family oxidoreductase [Candidatus Berkiella cookevillensis]MCS5707925.1 SDR family oxidoreductase [Candidatus Berkiella cookevillensis]